MWVRVGCLAIGYLFGLFQTSYIYGKAHGIDIRNYGSGNAGTTNMMRTLGTKAGLITFFGDCVKCMLAVGRPGMSAVRKKPQRNASASEDVYGSRNDPGA